MKSATVASRRSERSTPKSRRERQPESMSEVSRNVLLGMVPVLMPAPPTSAAFSTRATFLPSKPRGQRSARSGGTATKDDEIKLGEVGRIH